MSEALLHLPETADWQIGQLTLQRLYLEGEARACRLCLWVAVHLQGEGGDRHAQLDLSLISDPWIPSRRLPSASPAETLPSPRADDDASPLGYTLTEAVLRPQLHPRAATWLRYLGAPEGLPVTAGADASLLDILIATLSHWLAETSTVGTVAGAEAAARYGAVGYFGPVEPWVLERSGQADLAVEATCLGDANDARENGGEPTTYLTLYGERFGRWLLYRRNVKVLKAQRKDAPAPRQLVSSVLVADSAEALIAQVELTPAEKRLFQQVGILPDATLWPGEEQDVSEEDSGSGSAFTDATASPAALDLSAVRDRPRRNLQAIVQLVSQGKLDTADTDLLLKTARQLSRSKAGR